MRTSLATTSSNSFSSFFRQLSVQRPGGILFPHELDVENIVFSEPKKNQKGGKYVLISYEGHRLRVQTPPMRAPFGISSFQETPNDWNLYLSFGNMEEDASLQQLYDAVGVIEEKVLASAIDQGAAWFGKPHSDESIRDMFKSSIKMMKEKYPPMLKSKVPLAPDGSKQLVVDLAKLFFFTDQ